MLGDDEIQKLIQTTLAGAEHSGMEPRARAMLYLTCLGTGLRASEAASLTWRSFDLNDTAPTVKVLAAYSKHRRDDCLPLRKDLAGILAEWRDTLRTEPDNKVFVGFNPNRGAAMLRRDLAAAGVAYEDEAGRKADLHALRHTYVSRLCRAGIAPRLAQSLARHSTSRLTLDVYAHVSLHDERTAIESLPGLPGQGGSGEAESSQALRVGTDARPVEISRPLTPRWTPQGTPTAYPECQQTATDVPGPSGPAENSGRRNSLPQGTLGRDKEHVSSNDTQIGEGGIRTRGRGIRPYDGLANRCLQPLGHLSKGWGKCIRTVRGLQAQ